MKALEKISEEDHCGVRFYVARNKIKLARHRLVLIDVESIADKSGLTLKEVLKAIELSPACRESAYLVISPDGIERKKAIRVAYVGSLFQFLYMTTNGNPMIKSAKTIVEHAIELATKEENQIHAN